MLGLKELTTYLIYLSVLYKWGRKGAFEPNAIIEIININSARGGTIQYRKSSMCMCVYACLRVCIDNNVHICVRVLPSNSQRVIIYILLELDEVILSSINSKT